MGNSTAQFHPSKSGSPVCAVMSVLSALPAQEVNARYGVSETARAGIPVNGLPSIRWNRIAARAINASAHAPRRRPGD